MTLLGWRTLTFVGYSVESTRVCFSCESSTGLPHFHIVYATLPQGPSYLIALPSLVCADAREVDMIEAIHSTHRATRDQSVEANVVYKSEADRSHRAMEFEPGDFVWAMLTRDRYPAHGYNTLAAQNIGHLAVLAKINPNAYRLNLPSHLRTSVVFNVKHLNPYSSINDDDFDDTAGSRANLISTGENDVPTTSLAFMEAHDRVFKLKK
ncbi:hypothetical protein OROMI_026163 [Orobanche minor]